MPRLMRERIQGPILLILPLLRYSILVKAPDVVAKVLEDFLANRLTAT